MRIALSDDPGRPDTTHFARVRLDGDLDGRDPIVGDYGTTGEDGEASPAAPGWALTVRARGERGRDTDGTKLYGWSTVWEGRALGRETSDGLALSRGRQETSDAAGQTFETRTALLPGARDLGITETAVAWDADGHRWEITGVEDQPGGTQLRLERVVDDGT